MSLFSDYFWITLHLWLYGIAKPTPSPCITRQFLQINMTKKNASLITVKGCFCSEKLGDFDVNWRSAGWTNVSCLALHNPLLVVCLSLACLCGQETSQNYTLVADKYSHEITINTSSIFGDPRSRNNQANPLNNFRLASLLHCLAG